jgi:hypothetical protein
VRNAILIAIGVTFVSYRPASACAEHAHCVTATEYFCNRATNQCTAGNPVCSNDDAADQGGGDDWIPAARPLPLDQRESLAICGGGSVAPLADEVDWFYVDLPVATKVVLEVSSPVSLELRYAIPAVSGEFPLQSPVIDLDAGRTYLSLRVPSFVGSFANAMPYSVFLHRWECFSASDCLLPSAPTCSSGYRCVPGPMCASDDVRDSGNGDDTPMLATPLSLSAGVPETLEGALCAVDPTSDHGPEEDWMVVHVAKTEGLRVSVPDAASSLYFTIYGPGGKTYGENAVLQAGGWVPGTEIELTHLPEADYLVKFWRYPAPIATAAYQPTIEVTPADPCTSNTDCEVTSMSQVPRPVCHAGACTFMAPPDPRGNVCRVEGRCPNDSWICRGYQPPGNDPACLPSCPEVVGHCGPCVSTEECGADVCIDGLCLPPQEEETSPMPAEGGGCSASSGIASLWMLLGALGAISRRRARQSGAVTPRLPSGMTTVSAELATHVEATSIRTLVPEGSSLLAAEPTIAGHRLGCADVEGELVALNLARACTGAAATCQDLGFPPRHDHVHAQRRRAHFAYERAARLDPFSAGPACCLPRGGGYGVQVAVQLPAQS